MSDDSLQNSNNIDGSISDLSADQEKKHPIAEAIDCLVSRAEDIKYSARQFIPLAYKDKLQQLKQILKAFESNLPLFEDPDCHKRILAQSAVQTTVFQLERLARSDVPGVIQSGLFLALFSAFDAFTGDLLHGLYLRKPLLFNSLEKTLTFSDVLAAKTIEDLKQQVLDDNIEDLRRKSYSEQFACLSQRYKIKLTEFENWPAFVECSQRRNLITHCDGIVTEQYYKVCRDADVKESSLAPIGSKVKIGAEYFYSTCELVIEVGIKLGQTLWRKTLPEEISEADNHIMSLLYGALENRNWPRAKMIGEYAFRLPKFFSEQNQKIITVNFAQALLRDGEKDRAKSIIDNIDWSATTDDFKLARAVLLQDYSDAEIIMMRIGKQGQLTNENSYHTWPLFIEFRETENFARAYFNVFGYPFAEKLKEEATEASRKAAAEVALELPIVDGTQNLLKETNELFCDPGAHD
ncbi:MAG: hypothetical protein KBB26_10260 [Candidatus Omnitrophica bacterium]|nr:hypothetical protein [Candidatus Omnitrophota bacterium]HNU01891.1 hypothetical protein [Acidobacteriota bacterium]